MTAIEEAVAGYSEEEKPLGSYATLIAVYNTAFLGTLALAKVAGRELPPRVGFADVALIGLGTHKLSRLLARDRVTSALRAPFTRYERKGGPAQVEERPRGTGLRRVVGELLVCPYCLDQWIAAGFVNGLVFAPRATRLVASTFAAVALADFLQMAYKAGEDKLR